MIYRSFDALIDAYGELVDTCTDKIILKEETLKIGRLCRLYLDAYNNPPEGVVGVGIVTYAESLLTDYQQKEV